MTTRLQRLMVMTLTGLAMLSTHRGHANNIQVTNAAITGNDNAQGFCFVQFDVTWQNSWRLNGVVNWDAAWVFVKFRSPNGNWQHALLGNTGHTAPAGSQIDVGLLTPGSTFNATTNPVIGTFIRRSADGTGTFSATGVQLRWNYAQQGIGFNDLAEVRVFGIEMVYVNQGAFAVGGLESNAFTLTTITTANPLTAPSGAGSLGGQAGGFPTGQAAPTSASWPNGFNAFYCMKYEVTQQGYVDFLNSLTRTQQNARTLTDVSGTAITDRYVMAGSATVNNRNGIRCDATVPTAPAPITFYCDLNGNGIGGEATDGQWIACGYLGWKNLAAYLEWSGLRPMTDLEFEKACRGPLLPVANEYPWGTTGLVTSPYSLNSIGAANEGIAANYSATLGNASHSISDGTINGPLRVGIFAANGGNSGRVSAGASYYGIMELGGNLFEITLNIGNVDGRSFTGTHGNGILASTGDHDAPTWPITIAGTYFRGGSFISGASEMRVSDRSGSAPADVAEFWGGRGVRTAP